MSRARKSAKQRIIDHLRQVNTYVSGKALEELATSWGYKPSYISREARRLEEEDEKISKRYTEDGYVEYSSSYVPKPAPRKIKIITKPDGSQVATYV